MSGMILEELRFSFVDAEGKCTLLADAGNFSANQSRALFHYIDEDYIVWEMRDNLKNIMEYIERGAESEASIRAALAVMAVRAFWGKYRSRRVLWMGAQNRATIGIAKMLPIVHEENRLYAVSSDFPDVMEDNVVPICASCESFPLPEHFFDVAVVDGAEVSAERMTQILLSLRVGGLLLFVLPAGAEFLGTIPGAASLSDDAGNTLLYARLTRETKALLAEETLAGQLALQKRLVSYILDEVGGSLGTLLATGDAEQLDAAIAQVSLAEDTFLPIYEELLSEDVKYLANRFKESLIEFRLHQGKERRGRVMEDYFALRREMKEQDDF